MDKPSPKRDRSLFSGAIGFYEAARSLYQVTGEFRWPAFYVNLAYSAELSVKAFIVHKNLTTTDNALQSDIGHKLNIGLQKAIDAGYLPPNKVTAELFKILHVNHVNHQARYLSGDSVEMKPHALMLKAMAHHLTSIGAQMSMPINLQTPS